jgi:hemoglobin
MELRKNRGWLATPARAGLVLTTLVALLLIFPGRGFAQDQTQSEKPKEKTLYDRLGGYDAVSAVVDDFLAALGKDPMFDRFGHGRGANSLQRAKQLIKDQICSLTGGPCAYIGRDMATAHQGLEITQKEWDASVQHLQATLVKFKVGEKEQKELLAMVDKLKADIIEKPKKDAGKDKKEETVPAKN